MRLIWATYYTDELKGVKGKIENAFGIKLLKMRSSQKDQLNDISNSNKTNKNLEQGEKSLDDLLKSDKENRTKGKSGKTYTSDNKPVNFHYEIRDINDLLVSHDEDGNENPNYPQELQPRDRTNAASKLDLETQSSKINP